MLLSSSHKSPVALTGQHAKILFPSLVLFVNQDRTWKVTLVNIDKGYKETVQVAESTILVVSKAQSRICNESLLDKAYRIYWIIEF